MSKPKSDKPKSDKPKSDKPKSDKPKSDKPKSDKIDKNNTGWFNIPKTKVKEKNKGEIVQSMVKEIVEELKPQLILELQQIRDVWENDPFVTMEIQQNHQSEYDKLLIEFDDLLEIPDLIEDSLTGIQENKAQHKGYTSYVSEANKLINW